MNSNYPLYILYGGLIIEFSPSRQYFPIPITTAYPVPFLLKSPLMMQFCWIIVYLIIYLLSLLWILKFNEMILFNKIKQLLLLIN